MKVRIEGSGHCVEIEAENGTAAGLLRSAERVWLRTRVPEKGQPIGYAAQHLERTDDQPVKGAGDYQRQVKPVTA